MIVLDSSAVLAFLFDESGGEAVRNTFDSALVSSVNVAEIITAQIDRGAEADAAVLRMEDLDLEIRPFDRELALLAGKLRWVTRPKGLSFGDRACLALAIRENATAMTADRAWADLDVGCRIELIR